jgi:hypothetical protein
MVEGSQRRAVLVWLDAERADGFDVEYAVIEPGSRFSPSELVNSGTQAFNGAKSQQAIRVWSATFGGGDRSRFVFDYEIAGVRQSAEATLAGSKLSFKTGAARHNRAIHSDDGYKCVMQLIPIHRRLARRWACRCPRHRG